MSALSQKQFSMSLNKVGNLTSNDMGKRVKSVEPEQIMEGYEEEDYSKLKKSIAKHGIKEPLVIKGAKLLEGHHRYLAAKELGLKTVPVKRVK